MSIARTGLEDDGRYMNGHFNAVGDCISELQKNIKQLEGVRHSLSDEQIQIVDRLILEDKEQIGTLRDAIFEDRKVKDVTPEEISQLLRDQRDFRSTKEQELKDAGINLGEERERKIINSEKWTY
ncbi:MAG: hypothetical protein JXA43_00080 [Candidatus Diapherotrites archaeon]|nr:hypothetical protein [Candidatus Diapherotrites archaeon]